MTKLADDGRQNMAVSMGDVLSKRFGGEIRSNIEVHHTDYSTVGNERFKDLLVVCRDCHDDLEAWIRRVMETSNVTRRQAMATLKPKMMQRLLEIHEIYNGKHR